MEWEKLLSLKRHGDNFKRKRIDQDETRLGFDVDYDRIIFSSEFRSLQDKTQVVPFSQGDFVHTRLTHSLETSVVGRSLGRRVGVEILKKYPYLKNDLGYHANDFGAIVASASLAHDIGNPPFGHSGEKSIGQYFMSGPGKKFGAILNDKEFQDHYPSTGLIEFMYGEKSDFRSDNLKFKPNVGKMLLFPSWLKHSVYPFYVDGERRSMSFNAHYKDVK